MTTTPSSPKHVVYAGPGADGAFLHGQSVGSFQSETEAGTELTHVQFEPCRRGRATGTPVSLADEPVGAHASEAPDSTLPVPAADLEAAVTRLRPDPALQKALKCLRDGGWAYQDDDELVIRFDPRSKGRGKHAPGSYTPKHDSFT